MWAKRLFSSQLLLFVWELFVFPRHFLFFWSPTALDVDNLSKKSSYFLEKSIFYTTRYHEKLHSTSFIV